TLGSLFDFDRIGIRGALMGNARGDSPQVKKLSTDLIRDHQRVDDRIVAYATKHKVELQPMSSDQKQRPFGTFEQTQGGDFDRQFVDWLISTHQQQVDQLTSQIGETKDVALRSLLQETKKTLDQHIQNAERVKKQLGGMATG